MIRAAATPVVHDLRARGKLLPTGSRCLVMGVVNVTPDSFHAASRTPEADAAVAHGLALAAEGADLLDVGGESSRPGARYVDAETELARVVPVVRGLAAATDVPISVDTRKGAVARAALAAGASVVNDISAGRDDPGLFEAAAEASAAVVLMHMRGIPLTMQDDPRYSDVVAEVSGFLAGRAEEAEAAGIAPESIVIDPGIGFGKLDEHNYALLGAIESLSGLGHPVLIGPSRKGFIGRALAAEPAPPGVDVRLDGTAAVVAWSVAHGARIVRVHDVGPMRRVVRMTEAIMRGRP